MPLQPKNPKKQEAIQLRQQGLTYAQIGHKLEVNPKSVAGWVGMDKRKKARQEQKALEQILGNQSFIPTAPQSNQKTPNLGQSQANTGAEFKSFRLTSPQDAQETGEQALRAEAFQILADGLRGKHHAKSKREWADKIIKATSKEKVSVIGKRGSTSQPDSKTTYSGMGDAELAERGIMGSVALVGGLAVEEIIKRLKDQGQFYI